MEQDDLEGARALVARVRTLTDSRETKIGNDIVRCVGPGGTWSLRSGLGPRGSLQYCFRPPSNSKYDTCYSLNGLIKHLEGFFREIEPTYGAHDLAAEPDSLDPIELLDMLSTPSTPEAVVAPMQQLSQEALRAAAIIAARFRSYTLRKMLRNKRVLEMSLDTVTAALPSVFQGVVAAVQHEIKTQPTRPLDTISEPMLLFKDVATSHHEISQSALLEEASRLMSFAPSSVQYAYGKGILKMGTIPVIVFDLPLPNRTRFVTLLTKRVKIVHTNELSLRHQALLLEKFHRDWHAHIQTAQKVRVFGIYDFFSTGTYIGSLIVSKFAVKQGSMMYPVVHVESIASVGNGGDGRGSVMLEFCKQLIFTDVADVTYGIIVAQCVKSSSFWKYVVTESNEARAIVVQLSMLHDTYFLANGCSPRSCTVFK